ncbi:NUDIX hydrolase [[Clostridium] fimetarium]|uniref:NUDIX domain-containing protein n=1 Tax=[Clostridium] fimetarium TaxID=99656 RepID=A0A1I0QTG3_9FIRM|nr:NUDIX hydrolase [[Clostridium] fimetarium]SEW30646.1 NUDIX domain-containing protein [[Clostridium] fimetarium]
MKWKCLNSEYLVNSKWLKVRRDEVQLPNGTIMDDYFVIEKKNVALIVAMDKDKSVILKKEYRYAIDKELIEIPGGTYDNDSDNPLDVAKRELREETGYKSDNWECLGTLFDYPTKDTNTISLYLAKNIYKVGEQELDISEDITFDFVPIKEAIQMCVENQICVSGSVAALMKVFYQM